MKGCRRLLLTFLKYNLQKGFSLVTFFFVCFSLEYQQYCLTFTSLRLFINEKWKRDLNKQVKQGCIRHLQAMPTCSALRKCEYKLRNGRKEGRLSCKKWYSWQLNTKLTSWMARHLPGECLKPFGLVGPPLHHWNLLIHSPLVGWDNNDASYIILLQHILWQQWQSNGSRRAAASGNNANNEGGRHS